MGVILSEEYVGELVKVSKNSIGLAIDTTGKQRAVRLTMGSTFLVLGISDKNIPEIWKSIPLFKILPIGNKTYDDFTLNVKFVPIALYVDPENIELVDNDSAK